MSRTTQMIHPDRDERQLRIEQRRRREEGTQRTIHLHPEPMGDTAPTAEPPSIPTVADGAIAPADDCPAVFWWVHRSLTRQAPTYGEYALMAATTDPHADWKGEDIKLHSRFGDVKRLTSKEWARAVMADLIQHEPIRTYRQRAIAIALAQGTLTPRSAVEEMYALHTQDDARHAGVGA